VAGGNDDIQGGAPIAIDRLGAAPASLTFGKKSNWS
jgi:hypothetical protein